MQRHQDKARTNVLDYNSYHQPESRQERRWYRLAIGVLIILFAAYLSNWMDYYEAYRLMTSMRSPAYKLGLAFAYVFTPLGITLTLIGLYQRTNYGYWLTGLFTGALLMLVSSFLFELIVYAKVETFNLPVVIIAEFILPLLLVGYLLLFLTRSQVSQRCNVNKTTALFMVLMGYVLAGVVFTLLLS